MSTDIKRIYGLPVPKFNEIVLDTQLKIHNSI